MNMKQLRCENIYFFINIFFTHTSLATSYLNLSKASIASGTNFLLLLFEFAIVIHLLLILTLSYQIIRKKVFFFSKYIVCKKAKFNTEKKWKF